MVYIPISTWQACTAMILIEWWHMIGWSDDVNYDLLGTVLLDPWITLKGGSLTLD